MKLLFFCLVGLVLVCLLPEFLILLRRTSEIAGEKWTLFRQKSQRRQQWPDALLLLATSLKVGLTLEDAFEVMVNESPEPLQSALRVRLAGASAWLPLAERAQLIFSEPYLLVLRQTFVLAAQTGASYATLLESQAQTLRKKHMLEKKMEALTAQSRMTAWVVAGSPLLLGALLWGMAPEFISPFFTTSLGRFFLGAAIVLNATGFLVIHYMLKSDE